MCVCGSKRRCRSIQCSVWCASQQDTYIYYFIVILSGQSLASLYFLFQNTCKKTNMIFSFMCKLVHHHLMHILIKKIQNWEQANCRELDITHYCFDIWSAGLMQEENIERVRKRVFSPKSVILYITSHTQIERTI